MFSIQKVCCLELNIWSHVQVSLEYAAGGQGLKKCFFYSQASYKESFEADKKKKMTIYVIRTQKDQMW